MLAPVRTIESDTEFALPLSRYTPGSTHPEEADMITSYPDIGTSRNWVSVVVAPDYPIHVIRVAMNDPNHFVRHVRGRVILNQPQPPLVAAGLFRQNCESLADAID